MNSNSDEKHTSRRLNIQVCELLQVLNKQKLQLEGALKNKCFWNSKTKK